MPPNGEGATYGNGKVGHGMSATIWEKSDWPTVGVCLALSGFGLSAVPFIGTKYGDWPEATALAIGLLPLVYIAIRMSLRFNQPPQPDRGAPAPTRDRPRQPIAEGLIIRGGFDRLHIGIRQAEMMADLVHQDVRDNSTKRIFVFGPVIEDRAAVEPDHIRHRAGYRL